MLFTEHFYVQCRFTFNSLLLVFYYLQLVYSHLALYISVTPFEKLVNFFFKNIFYLTEEQDDLNNEAIKVVPVCIKKKNTFNFILDDLYIIFIEMCNFTHYILQRCGVPIFKIKLYFIGVNMSSVQKRSISHNLKTLYQKNKMKILI